MINISREKKVPESLNSEPVREYLKKYAEYKIDPKNIKKPEKPFSYRNSDLLEAFDRCFFSKCYLTEEKFYNSWKLDVDHFIPQNERGDLVYDWDNLYPAEPKANMSRPRRTPPGGYLDPCADSDDVETGILYSLSTLGYKPRFEATDNSKRKSVNTANLLNKLHNGREGDDYSKKNTGDLRHAIHKKHIKILNKIIKWREQTENTQEEFQLRRELQEMLSRKSSFTMLIRSMPAVKRLPDEFFD